MNNDPRICKVIENTEVNIKLLATLSDKKLAEKLDAIHLQGKIAMEKKITSSIELLEIWRNQVIAARIYKSENEVSDAINEIEITISDIETYVAEAEEHQDELSELNNPGPLHQTKLPQQQDSEVQLTLF